MKKLLLGIFLLCAVGFSAYAQQEEKKSGTRAFNSEEDRGWYFLNGAAARWNAFGAYYQGRLYYKEPLFREQNSFWFADSAIIAGVEQDLGPFSRTSAYLFFQPVIALSFELRVGYEKDLSKSLRPVMMDGPHSGYDFALPPFTGLNPMAGNKPNYMDTNGAIAVEFTPKMTMGGKAGPGMIALMYTPTISYIHNLGMDANQYYFNGRYVAVMKSRDVLWSHDLSLGYAITGTGWSVAATGLLEQVQSSFRIMRAGIFAAVSYEKPLENYPSIIPYFRGRIGSWLWDDYMQHKVAVQMQTGINWKFY